MFRAIIVVFVLISSLIICYAVFADPLSYLVDTFNSIDDTNEDTMNLLPWALGASVVFGIFFSLILLAMYGHKKEYEQE
jgi:predicted membrane protein